MKHHVIVRVIAKLVIPGIILFALYVQFHGDYGPGGGFQAGIIFASAFILYGLVFGVDKVRQVAPPWILTSLVAIGLMLFTGVGIAAMVFGGNFLEYAVFFEHDFAESQKLGILLVELGVGITVAAVMMTVFFLFAGRIERDAEPGS